MIKKSITKLSRSLAKLILPFFFKILINLKINRRVVNFLSEKGYDGNNKQNFVSQIQGLLHNNKIVALDVGAQGGFNSDNYFPKRYNSFFKEILVEPIESESQKLNNEALIINKGLWSSKERKTLYILDNRLGSSSMFKPKQEYFDIHNIKDKNYDDYKITRTCEIECDTINNQLSNLNIKNLDYLKIDTQGAELEILKGIGNFKPLLIKLEVHIFSMYEGAPNFSELLNHLNKLNYVMIDWKTIGDHISRVPAEMDVIFIPNFNNEAGKKLILDNKEKFISLMLIFGQIELLKTLIKRYKMNYKNLENLVDYYFN
jgi:FkbM family methyltransferase